MPKYNHMFSVCFEVISDQANGEDVTQDMLHQALSKRSQDLTRNSEWREAVGAPEDTYEIEPPSLEEQVTTLGRKHGIPVAFIKSFVKDTIQLIETIPTKE